MVRFEILLPLYYNDGRSIEGTFHETAEVVNSLCAAMLRCAWERGHLARSGSGRDARAPRKGRLRMAECESTNCQLEFERCRILLPIKGCIDKNVK